MFVRDVIVVISLIWFINFVLNLSWFVLYLKSNVVWVMVDGSIRLISIENEFEFWKWS